MIGLLKTEVNFDGTTQKFVTSLLKKKCLYLFAAQISTKLK